MSLRDAKIQDATLSIRLYRSELDNYKKAAKNAGKTLAEAVRDVMNAWSKRQNKKAA